MNTTALGYDFKSTTSNLLDTTYLPVLREFISEGGGDVLERARLGKGNYRCVGCRVTFTDHFGPTVMFKEEQMSPS